MADDEFRTSISEFGAAAGGVKQAGEGAAPAKYEWGWDGPEPEDETSFEDLWAQRATTPSTTTTGSLGPPSGFAGAGAGGDTGGIVAEAMRFIGTPYKWGGNTPLGFDCSGFTSYVYKNVLGITLPRVSYQQGNGGRSVSREDVRPGDLIFYDNSSRNMGADHVGIYIGNGKYVNAPQPGKSVMVSDVGTGWWARRYT